jgi:hypothetical protein
VLHLGLLLLAAAVPRAANATLYTIDGNSSLAGFQPIAFSSGGVSGSILPSFGGSGTNTLLAGSVTNAGAQDWLIFQVQLNGGSLSVDQVGVSSVGVATVLGVGYQASSGETPTGGSLSGSVGLIDFDHLVSSALNLQAGETSDHLFGTFALGALPGPGLPPIIAPGTASFMISGGANFSVQGKIVAVPEPIALVGLSMGLAGLAAWRPARKEPRA